MMEVSNKCDLAKQLKKGKRALALFYASWCPYCRCFLAVFDKTAAKRRVDLTLRVKIDDYANPLWDKYSIEAVPTIIFFDDGKVCRRLDGKFGQGLSEMQLREFLERI